MGFIAAAETQVDQVGTLLDGPGNAANDDVDVGSQAAFKDLDYQQFGLRGVASNGGRYGCAVAYAIYPICSVAGGIKAPGDSPDVKVAQVNAAIENCDLWHAC
jgi:hypothetical protein